MKTIPTTHRGLLNCCARAHSLRGWVCVPSTRLCSEINFHLQDRHRFWMFDPAFPVHFRFEGKKWSSLLRWILGTTPGLWEKPVVPDSVLRVKSGLNALYGQHPGLLAQLLFTKERHLRYDDARDGFWGCGPTGGGENRFGQILMDLRKAHGGGEAHA